MDVIGPATTGRDLLPVLPAYVIAFSLRANITVTGHHLAEV